MVQTRKPAALRNPHTYTSRVLILKQLFTLFSLCSECILLQPSNKMYFLAKAMMEMFQMKTMACVKGLIIVILMMMVVH